MVRIPHFLSGVPDEGKGPLHRPFARSEPPSAGGIPRGSAEGAAGCLWRRASGTLANVRGSVGVIVGVFVLVWMHECV